MGFTAVSGILLDWSRVQDWCIDMYANHNSTRWFCSVQIWISPIVKNIDGNAAVGEPYHGFWSKDITQVNEHFGTEEDLKALSKAVHDRGMLLMIDVVANNFASVGPGAATNFANFVPFNKKEYFHPYCEIQDYEDP